MGRFWYDKHNGLLCMTIESSKRGLPVAGNLCEFMMSEVLMIQRADSLA